MLLGSACEIKFPIQTHAKGDRKHTAYEQNYCNQNVSTRKCLIASDMKCY